MTVPRRRRKRETITGGRRPYGALATLLDRYFSADFFARNGTAEDGARSFIGAAKPGQVDRAARQLRRFHDRALEMEEGEWRTALAALGGAWQPSTLDALGGIASLLEESIPPRYQI